MAYNRWLSPDELEHHGVKGQTWGVTNGPPYPLSRQKRFRTIGPDGRPITSKVAYKKAMKVQRAANRSERRAHPNGTADDKRERNSFGAQVKRKFRETTKKWKDEREREEAEGRAAREKAKEELETAKQRLVEAGIPKDEADKILARVSNRGVDSPSGRFPWGNKKGDDADAAKELNRLIDQYEAKRNDAKLHGTVEEIMKYRREFSTEDWKMISDRLEAEETVSKYLDVRSDGLSGAPKDPALRALFMKGTAREVYARRSEFTPDQLESISKRLRAEDTIGQYANKQVDTHGEAYYKFKKFSEFLYIAGASADSISKIMKLFGASSGDGGKKKGDGNSGGGKPQNNQNDQKSPTGSKSSSASVKNVLGALGTLGKIENNLKNKKPKQ